MELSNFYLWEDYSWPYLQNMVDVIFTRGLKIMEYKNELSEFTVLDFLGYKVTKCEVLP